LERRALRLIVGVLLASFASTAHAACPMALAV
jgi:hypothetical protein